MTQSGYMVRAGNDNELISTFESNSFVAIGWADAGDVSEYDSYEAMKAHFRSIEEYAEYSTSHLSINAGQVFRFAHEISTGDVVLTYDKTEREYLVGTVKGEYEWQPEGYPPEYPHVRTVEWLQTISRDDLSTPTKNTLGSSLTVFSVGDRIDEITRTLRGERSTEETEEENTVPFVTEVENQADELISDILANMDPFVFEGLVAALLRAMGYHATKTRDVHDMGVDVVAHPDALGFDEPFIKAQVKRQQAKVGGPDMRSFTGTLGGVEKGLFVSTGGFTSDAEMAAKNSGQRVTLLDRDDFIDLLIQHYDTLEPEYQAKVPLRKVYIPSQDPPIED